MPAKTLPKKDAVMETAVAANTGFVTAHLFHLLPRWLRCKKNLPANAGEAGNISSIPGSGRSPGEENGNTFQYCLENPMDKGA